ncbi:MAG TPA: hypothetical protein VD903_01650, partial [Pseudonocardia sp.]|nr:hypothetical protein [Pseudonocardia sp.]
SRFEGENNDAWMAGFTPSLSSAVWMGTDMNSPIRTARGVPIKGSSLPGDVWQDFMSEALDDVPVEGFGPFRPIGEPPSPLGPNEEPPPPTPAPVSPTPTAPVPPSGASPRLPGDRGAPELTPTPEEPRFDDSDPPGFFGDTDEEENREDEDCSVTPCG